MTPGSGPPRLAVWLLRRLVPSELVDVVEGDLREGYSRRRRKRGRRAADWWAWRQVLGSRPLESRRTVRRANGRGRTLGGGWIEDLRSVVRRVRHRPAVAAAVSATVAVAVGATTAVFSVVNGVLLRPLDFPEPDRLVAAWQTNPEWMDHSSLMLRNFARRFPLSVPTFNDWQEANTGLESVGIVTFEDRTWQRPDRAENISTLAVTHGIFEVLAVPPAMGRVLLPDDDRPGASAVAVLSHGFWLDRLGGSADVLGTGITLDGTPHSVIGVMPPGFAVPGFEGAELWTSRPEGQKAGARDSQSFTAIGRLEPGATVASLEAELGALQDRLSERYPDEQQDFGANVEGLLEAEVGGVQTTLWFLLGSVGLVLAIACLNIANILSVTGIARRQELAVRAALGAERGRLVRGLLVESAALAIFGGLIGVVLAAVALPGLTGLLPPSLPRVESVAMDSTVLVFGVAVTTVTAMFVGILPALRAARVDPGQAMAEGARAVAGGSGGRARAALVVAEVALAFTLLVGAGLLSRSYVNLSTEERGFPTAGLAVMSVSPDVEGYGNEEEARAARRQFGMELHDRLRALPAMRISGSNQVPLSGSTSVTSVDIELADRTLVEDASVLITVVFPDYLDVMGIPLLQGRALAEADGEQAEQVAVVNEALANAYWAGETAIGRRIRDAEREEWRTVVGVVGDVRHQSIREPAEPKIYLPASQSRRTIDQWILRADDPATALSRAREVVAELSPTTSVRREVILDDRIAQSMALPRFRTLFVVSLAGLATVLALLGVYGVVAFSVVQRTREVALRLALGARDREVVGTTLTEGLKLCVTGLVLGAAITVSGGRVLESFLYDLPTLDPVTYLLVTVVVALVGLAAGYVPARRASRVDPMTVLKSQ
ncbi:MAG: ADOP family duplicated permease [Longimicrobiales bacterium]|nr:ADOP family duplicated permease [Longimicrobiales bacterium]